jgi:K+-sensing histidine kinase KdpD
MAPDKRLLLALIGINAISTERRLDFQEKLQLILLEIIKCMEAESGSIMLLKGRNNLEVTASTRTDLIGTKQPLGEESPSSWVIKNRVPLRVDDIAESTLFQNRFDGYKGGAFLLVPIIGEKRVIGVLSVTDKIGKDVFSEEEQDVLLKISGQVINSLENQRLTESLKESKRSLQKKNQALKKLQKLKTELFNMLIHDLKGPMSEVVANLDILSYTLQDENLDFVRSAQTGCDTLFRMVSNLLDIARLEENRLQLVFEKIDPRDIIREAVARIFALVKAKDLRIEERFSPSETDSFLRGDRDVLLRVLQNLLSNAVQYSPPGETIEVGFQCPGSSEIEFYVKDHGPGIPAKHHDVVFDKFKQLERKADGRIYTTGLGLTFCKMAVEAHRGKIGIASNVSKGSSFFFILPAGK